MGDIGFTAERGSVGHSLASFINAENFDDSVTRLLELL